MSDTHSQLFYNCHIFIYFSYFIYVIGRTFGFGLERTLYLTINTHNINTQNLNPILQYVLEQIYIIHSRFIKCIKRFIDASNISYKIGCVNFICIAVHYNMFSTSTSPHKKFGEFERFLNICLGERLW